MPLNSSHLDNGIIRSLREIPMDKDCGKDSYQTKVSIYDCKCSGCGFMRVECHGAKDRLVIFNNIELAIKFVINRRAGWDIIRTCSYPLDIQLDMSGNEVYPTLNEIVSNTCQFWNEDKLQKFSNEESSFIEVKDINEGWVGERLSEIGHIRESVHSQNIPQQETTGTVP